MPRTTLREDSSDISPDRSRSTKQPRIVGVDDGSFQIRKGTVGSAIIVAVLFHGSRISAARVGRVEVDGTDANDVLSALLKSMTYEVVMLSGISFGGFNLVDIKRLSEELGKPVIAVVGAGSAHARDLSC